MVVLSVQEGFNELGRIRNKGFGMLVNAGNRKDGILADVGVAMLQTGPSGGEEWFDELCLPQFAQEAEGVASNIFIRVLEIASYSIAVSCLLTK